MENFNIRLKTALSNKKISQAELSRISGITPSSICDWLKGKYVPKHDKISKLASCLDVTPNWLLGVDDYIYESSNVSSKHLNEDFDNYIDNIRKVQILGTICAGDGVYCEEEYGDFMFIDQSTRADFALRVSGDSMQEAGILDGDTVFIRKCSSVANGKIAAVLLTESNEASLKKFYKTKDHVVLQPCNSDYEPIITRNVIVLGECVGVYREL